MDPFSNIANPTPCLKAKLHMRRHKFVERGDDLRELYALACWACVVELSGFGPLSEAASLLRRELETLARRLERKAPRVAWELLTKAVWSVACPAARV